MFGNFKQIAKRFIKNSVGSVGGSPRILNIDKLDTNDDPIAIIGYIEINQQATTPFSRTKVHKGWFFCEESEIDFGDLVKDRVDDNYYFAMSIKKELWSDKLVYFDATMYFCDSLCTIQRYVDRPRDFFGEHPNPAWDTLGTNKYCMLNPYTFDNLIKPDRPEPIDKIKVVLQEKEGVREQDRLILNDGTIYKVNSVDNLSLKNLTICYVTDDFR